VTGRKVVTHGRPKAKPEGHKGRGLPFSKKDEIKSFALSLMLKAY
jgi:hypothetical protein